MADRLIVEGQEVDMYDKSVSLNFQINDLGDISTRNSTFSNSINLPRTAKNDLILGSLNVVGSQSRIPYSQHRCSYLQDEIPLVENGFFQVREVTDKYYRCSVIDGIADLSEKLKGLTLNDLNLADFNHVLDRNLFKEKADATSGYIYSLADFGKGISGVPALETQAPSVFLRDIFDRIFELAGVSYSGSFFDNPSELDTEVLTVNNFIEVGGVTPTITDKGYALTDSVTVSDIRTYPFFVSEPFTIGTAILSSPVSRVGNTIAVANSGTYKFEIQIDYDFNDGSQVNVAFNSSEGQGILTPLMIGSGTKNVEFTLSMAAGETVSFSVSGQSKQVSPGNPDHELNFEVDLRVDCFEISGGYFVNFNGLMGDKIKLIDVVKDLMQRYGLMLRPVGLNKDIYEFEAIQSILTDRAGAFDHSDRFDRVLNISYEPSYAKENTASYQYGQDQEPTHDGILTVDNEIIEPDKPLFKSPFEISPKAGNFYEAPIWKEKSNDGTVIYEPNEISNRIFKVDYRAGSLGFTLDGVNDSTVGYSILTTDGLQMQQRLDSYYGAFKSLIDNYKKVEVQFNMRPADYLKIDFFKLVYIEQLQAYFYLQKITNTGKATLLQINSF